MFILPLSSPSQSIQGPRTASRLVCSGSHSNDDPSAFGFRDPSTVRSAAPLLKNPRYLKLYFLNLYSTYTPFDDLKGRSLTVKDFLACSTWIVGLMLGASLCVMYLISATVVLWGDVVVAIVSLALT